MKDLKVFGYNFFHRILAGEYKDEKDPAGLWLLKDSDLGYLGIESGEVRGIYVGLTPQDSPDLNKDFVDLLCFRDMQDLLRRELDVELQLGDVKGGGRLIMDRKKKKITEIRAFDRFIAGPDWIRQELITDLRSRALFEGWNWSLVD